MKNFAKSTVALIKVAKNDETLVHPLLVGAVVVGTTTAGTVLPAPIPLHLSSKQHLDSHFLMVTPGMVWLHACFFIVSHLDCIKIKQVT